GLGRSLVPRRQELSLRRAFNPAGAGGHLAGATASCRAQRHGRTMIKTTCPELVGVEHPIVQGGMQWVGRAELVAAVANAGALGFITAPTHATPADLREET